MRYSVIVLSVLMVLMFMVSCNPKPDTYIVATVNGERIMLGDVMKGKQFEMVVQEEINKRKITQFAKVKKVTVNKAEVEKKYQSERSKVGSDKEWEEFLKVRGLTVDSAKNILTTMQLQYDLALAKAKPVTDEKVDEEWKKNTSWWQSVVANDLKATSGVNKDAKTITFAEAKPIIKKTLNDQTAQEQFPKLMKEIDDYFSQEGKIVLEYLPVEERMRRTREEKEQRNQAKKQEQEMEKRQRDISQKGENIKAETGGGTPDSSSKNTETRKENPKAK